MGYTDLDQLAINTIRILAVSCAVPAAMALGVQLEGLLHLETAFWASCNGKLCQIVRLLTRFSRLMPPPRPTRVTPVPLWAWPRSPTSCSTSS